MTDPARINDVAERATRAVGSMPKWMQKLRSQVRVISESDNTEGKSAPRAKAQVATENQK